MTGSRLPARDAIVDLLASQGRAMHMSELASRLRVAPADVGALERMLDDMAYEALVVPLDGHRFRVKREAATQHHEQREGALSVNPRGFGFVSAVGFPEDLFVPAESMRGAMHGDRVVARVVARSNKGLEGEVVRISSRGTSKVAGVLRRRGKSAWLEPDDMRVRGPIVLGRPAIGDDGDAAVARILRYPERNDENPEGELEAVLGAPGDPNVEVAKILVRESVDEAHPLDAVREAEAFGAEVSASALEGREDLTHLPMPTIDPEDARDHDDAVWAVRLADGTYDLWVAIADVSHYVRPGTALDHAARARGCSIYLPDRAIPMLPRALSSNLCSLLPERIRLCLCVHAKIDATGEITSFRVVEGFIRSAAKLTYGGVARALGFTELPKKSPEAEAMKDDLRVLADLSGLLRAKRMRRGALDFDLPEVKLTLDPKTGAPIGIERRAEDPGVKRAYQLIEEMMLLANELVAQLLVGHAIGTIFRVHGAPDEAKLDRFASMCQQLGIQFDVEEAKDPKRLAAFLKKIAKHESKGVFHGLLLRAMKQATYDTANIGHFGLASGAYLHFTSPIRRYPDLVVHRTVRKLLRKEKLDASEGALEELRAAAQHSSERERHAMEVEREVVDLYRTLYMRGRIGERFVAKVTALVGSGAYMQIASPFCDVLVRNEDLGADAYALSDDGLSLVGRRSGDRISLGDEIEVEIVDAAVQRRTVYARRVGVPAREDAGPGRPHGKGREGGGGGGGRGGGRSDARSKPGRGKPGASKPGHSGHGPSKPGHAKPSAPRGAKPAKAAPAKGGRRAAKGKPGGKR